MKKLNGSQMISEALKHEGVSVVFGYPGGAALNIYDETYKQEYFTHILTRHEQAALHAMNKQPCTQQMVMLELAGKLA